MSESYDENIIQIKRMTPEDLALALKEYDEKGDKRFTGPMHRFGGWCNAPYEYCELEQSVRDNNYSPTQALLNHRAG